MIKIIILFFVDSTDFPIHTQYFLMYLNIIVLSSLYSYLIPETSARYFAIVLLDLFNFTFKKLRDMDHSSYIYIKQDLAIINIIYRSAKVSKLRGKIESRTVLEYCSFRSLECWIYIRKISRSFALYRRAVFPWKISFYNNRYGSKSFTAHPL